LSQDLISRVPSEQDSFAVLFRRILPAAVGLLPRLDLPRRAILHRQHNAFVHDNRGSLSKPALPDEIWTQQNEEKSDAEDHLRLDPQHRDQFTSELDVLEGEPSHFPFFFYVTARIILLIKVFLFSYLLFTAPSFHLSLSSTFHYVLADIR